MSGTLVLIVGDGSGSAPKKVHEDEGLLCSGVPFTHINHAVN